MCKFKHLLHSCMPSGFAQYMLKDVLYNPRGVHKQNTYLCTPVVYSGKWGISECYTGLKEENKKIYKCVTSVCFLSIHRKLTNWKLKIEFFTISSQYKNANIANIANSVLAVPFKIEKTSKVCKHQNEIPFTY